MTINITYPREYFSKSMEEEVIKSAKAIVPKLLSCYKYMNNKEAKSVIDFGCATGPWLSVFIKHGITDIVGVDGVWMPKDLLIIPEDKFIIHDLNKPFSVKRSFDIAICLETPEHIDPQNAQVLLSTIAKHSNFVYFGGAIPGMIYLHHYNNQWQSYWCEKFTEMGYSCKDIRSAIWNDKRIGVQYKQNALIYYKNKNNKRIKKIKMLDVVHPDMAPTLKFQ